MTMRASSPEPTTTGCTGRTSRPRAHSSSASAFAKGASCSSVLTVGNIRSSLPEPCSASAAGEHPCAAHEARIRVAPDEQHLQALRAAPEQDHGRGRACLGGRLSHALSLDCGCMTTTTAQRWICESCGFIYHPEEGDPDGGIPPGTPFEEIPSDWYCPVCGARKADFTPLLEE